MPGLDFSHEALVELILNHVKDTKKQLKAMDIEKHVRKEYPEKEKKEVKEAVRLAIMELIQTKRLVYTYFGGSFIEMPHEEGAAKRG